VKFKSTTGATSLSINGKVYTCDKLGVIDIPGDELVALNASGKHEQIAAHGFEFAEENMP
jgi:hypothetical protein